MSDYFTDLMGMIWVQPDGPNTTCYPLFCHDVDSLDVPGGDVTTALCLNASRAWETVHTSQGAPSRATFTIETWLTKTRSWLQKQAKRRCPLPVYIHWSECGDLDTFGNYDTDRSLHNSIITIPGALGNMVLKRGEEGQAATLTTQSFELSANPLPPFHWKLDVTRRTIAEEEALRDVTFCNGPSCGGDCGAAKDPCTDGMTVADVTATAPDAWYSTDGWATGTASAAPFLATEDVASVVCFAVGRDTVRHLAVVGTTAVAAEIQYAYIDHYTDTDTWSTWSAVLTVTPSVPGEFASHGGALFALDSEHIWLCSNLGSIYFSSDAGLTWVDQAAPTPTPAEVLMCIRFLDDKYGMCVGGTAAASSVLLTTTDGGGHWLLGTGPATKQCTGVDLTDSKHAWITVNDGTLHYTEDFGANWAERVLTPAATKLGDVDFLNAYDGAVCGYKTVGADLLLTIWRTINGGANWEAYSYTVELDSAVVYFGLNAVWMCDENHIFAVGEQTDLTGTIMELSPVGSI